jgi:ribose/xylose/arabinose/galactoside ABC-type transport system permease subunit
VIGTFAGGLMLTLIVTFVTLTKLSIGFQYLIEGIILVSILAVSSTTRGDAA